MKTEEDFHVAASNTLDTEEFLRKLTEVEMDLMLWALTRAEGPGPTEAPQNKPFEQVRLGKVKLS